MVKTQIRSLLKSAATQDYGQNRKEGKTPKGGAEGLDAHFLPLPQRGHCRRRTGGNASAQCTSKEHTPVSQSEGCGLDSCRSQRQT